MIGLLSVVIKEISEEQNQIMGEMRLDYTVVSLSWQV